MHYCKFPLNIGYKLSYGTINSFDTILIEIENSEGKISYGEATFLEGYSSEKPEASFFNGMKLAQNVLNLDLAKSIETANRFRNDNPFLVSAFISAIEGFSKVYSFDRIKVPIIGLINEEHAPEIKKKIESLIAGGYNVIKTKIGNSLENDLKKLELIDKYADGRLKIRVDANQALENKNIDEIINDFSSFNIQYLEQPFEKENFDKHQELNSRSEFPIMLDESIWDFQDIDKVHEKSIAEYIKLKLQKCGGMVQFEAMINYLKERKINIIIGNGVQTDLNCLLEAQIYNKCNLTEAAENIGFAKLSEPITKNKIMVREGNILVMDKPIELDKRVIEKYVISEKIIP